MGSDEKLGFLHGKYELGRVIGHGSFAKVYVARNLQTGKSVAMKAVDKEKVIRVGMMEQVKREISVMKMIHHPNVVELHEVMASKTKIYLAMEFLRGGELFERIHRRGRLGEEAARSYFRQLISAVDFCHSRGVFHRDLKPENLLLDEKGSLKVTDFGLSALSNGHLRSDGLLHTTCGTPAYVAPEVIGNRGYDGAKADIWSCGVILYVLLAGFLPFREGNIVSLYRKISRSDFNFPAWFSPESRRLISKILDPNPGTRITIAKIMDSSWFKKPERSNQEVQAGDEADAGGEVSETLNAFHIISLSEGFNLSPLFEDKKRVEKEEVIFATTRTASSVISKIEELGKTKDFMVRKGESRVMLQGRRSGRKGKLSIAADVFPVAPSLMVVEVKKSSGDTLEYNQFCTKDLKPALRDIQWTTSAAAATSPPAAA
ncbi:CBL-interacting serine/threonine-protein kinase 6-like [Andrographis paniculata]|uniref:CBL-interacting serine/threonine-protein kinase 6-like n=1 Tax=Andrographis paniculata TaxID=175694 RepID=UPI0021E7CE8D|nr:CBL-interacting serine/threonine-protein kinase 6-like [Andrographis paniculata]